MHLCPARFLCLIGFAFCVAGCQTTVPLQVPETAPPVRLTVKNLTGHGWRVVVRTVGGETARTAEVAPRGTVSLSLARGGHYEIEQTLLHAGAGEGTTRRFPAQFEPGQEYEWSLATVTWVEEESSVPAEIATRE